MIIEVEEWNGVPIPAEEVQEWIRETVTGVSKDMEDPTEETARRSIMSGNTMVLVEGERLDGQVFIDGYVMKIEKHITVTL